jgi:LmbE family N-acetylglucosaminyl deacetylase
MFARTAPRLLALVLLCSTARAADPPLQPLSFDQGATGLALALRRLGSDGRVLYVTAHPDDEHNGVLVALSRGRGMSVGLLTLTRGEGGQNEIGPELFDALSVLRTEELAGVHRYDGVDQIFGRAVDFGYSFSVAETLARWGHEATLSDVVRAVRSFRPDVILTLPLEGERGGLHHQTAARLAREAFRAAADPALYPQQLTAGLRAWQARKIYQGGVGGGADPLPGPPPVVMTTSTYDALLGMTWQELGSLARASYRSQGAGQLRASPGQGQGAYALVDAVGPARTDEADIFEGIDTSVAGLVRFAGGAAGAEWLVTGLAGLQVRAGTLQANFDARAPQKSAAPLAAYLDALRALRNRISTSAIPEAAHAELVFRLDDEERDALLALALAHGLAFEVTADDGDVVPGQAFGVKATVWNQGGAPLRIDGVDLRVPEGWTATQRPVKAAIAEGAQGVSMAFEVRASNRARYSQPYWRRPSDAGRVEILVPEHEGLPWSPPDVVARLRFTSHGVAAALEEPAVWRYKAGGGGEKRKVVNVVPLLSARVAPAVTVVPVGGTATRREVKLAVLSNAAGPVSVTARLEVPDGWTVTPAQTTLEFRNEGEEVAARFEVAPPMRLAPGVYDLGAVATLAGLETREGYQAVSYDHVQERHLLRPATVRVLALDVRTAPGATVGYVMGTGDEVAEAIRQLGVPVASLGPDDLAFGDLGRYSTIVTGIRAYQVRPDLRSYHRRLMSYVEAGGNLVVQYNRLDFNQLSDPRGAGDGAAAAAAADSPFAPYPAAVTLSRITDESAPVRVLVPNSALLREPNVLGAADWAGWVQERGLQFLEARDPRYADVLAMTDSFPENPGEKKGALVETRVGRGTWTYVGLGLFRQLPAGVPGAYRLLANLVSRPRG